MLVAAASAAACVPMYPKVREERGGKVVDSASGQPVAGARVRVESYQVRTPPGYGGGGFLLHTLEVSTDRDGGWHVPSERDWTIGVLAADGLPLYMDVYCVFAGGYRPAFMIPRRAWFDLTESGFDADPNDRAMPEELRLERAAAEVHDPAAPGPGASPCGVPGGWTR